jgi:hypothetical protein
MSGLLVYNNTFHNVALGQVANDSEVNGASNSYARNNLWETSGFSGSGFAGYPHRGVTTDHNYYNNNNALVIKMFLTKVLQLQ